MLQKQGTLTGKTPRTGVRMEKKYLAYFQNILESWLEELLHQADDTVIGLRKNDEVPADLLDQANFESERNTGFGSEAGKVRLSGR